MDMIWMILAVLSFIGGQVYLLHCIKKLDRFRKQGVGKKPAFTYEDAYRYPEDSVIE